MKFQLKGGCRKEIDRYTSDSQSDATSVKIFVSIARRSNIMALKKIEKRIERLRRKYGMDFEEFFDATEDLMKFEQLMMKGFNPDEILRRFRMGRLGRETREA